MNSKLLTSALGGKSVKLLTAFAEKGLYILATILKSPMVTQTTTLVIVATVAKLREANRLIVGVLQSEYFLQ